MSYTYSMFQICLADNAFYAHSFFLKSAVKLCIRPHYTVCDPVGLKRSESCRFFQHLVWLKWPSVTPCDRGQGHLPRERQTWHLRDFVKMRARHKKSQTFGSVFPHAVAFSGDPSYCPKFQASCNCRIYFLMLDMYQECHRVRSSRSRCRVLWGGWRGRGAGPLCLPA